MEVPGMSDPYRDAEASLTENLEQRKAELDAIDQTLVPLHERREEVLIAQAWYWGSQFGPR